MNVDKDPKLFLSARRAHGQDDLDPEIAEALKKTATDKALAAWSQSQQDCDAAIAESLCKVPAPTGLKERILAGCQVRQSSWRGWFERRAWRSFRNSELVALAAILLLLGIAVAVQYARRGQEPGTWQEAAAIEVATIERAGSTDPLDHVASNFPSVRAWLTEQTCPNPATLPPPVQQLQIYGCSKRVWRGQPMSIVCFAFDRGREVHLVTIDRKHLPKSPPERALEFATVREYETASWSEGNLAMMLIGKVRREELESLLQMKTNAYIPRQSSPPILLSFLH